MGRPSVESGKHVHNAKPHPDESTTYPFSHRSLHAVTGQATDQNGHQCIGSQKSGIIQFTNSLPLWLSMRNVTP